MNTLNVPHSLIDILTFGREAYRLTHQFLPWYDSAKDTAYADLTNLGGTITSCRLVDVSVGSDKDFYAGGTEKVVDWIEEGGIGGHRERGDVVNV